MASPLSGSLAKAVYRAAKGIFLDATLTQVSVSGGAAYEPGSQTETAHACKVIVEAYSDHFKASGLIDQKDRKVLILAQSLSVTPKEGDKVTVSGITFTAMEVQTDPATAVWVVRGRM